MKIPSRKRRRQEALQQLIKSTKIATQEDLKEELEALGFHVTQSSLSRDINELGIVKQNGYYCLFASNRLGGIIPPITSSIAAGPNLIVLKTLPSMAPSMGAQIDSENLGGIVGTVAGDDTVFVATGPGVNKDKLIHNLRRMFS